MKQDTLAALDCLFDAAAQLAAAEETISASLIEKAQTEARLVMRNRELRNRVALLEKEVQQLKEYQQYLLLRYVAAKK